jgi:multidrug resistance protein
MKKQSTVALLALIMVVNALSYATIIPLLYPYSARFGITPLGMSFLLTSFSIAQFLATPILGRLSDRFGRKPLLLFSLAGTALSLAVFAMAQNVLMLFIARILDGVSGGNISIAQAVISDSTKGEERAKSFGMLGAAFGVGFLCGPAIGGLLSQYGMTTPFWVSSALAAIGVVLCYFLLPETLDKTVQRVQKHEPLFNFSALFKALFQPHIGVVLLISLLASMSMNAMILGFQTYTIDVLKLSTFQIGAFFSSFGLVGIIMQVFAIGPVLKQVKSKKKILLFSFIAYILSLLAAFSANTTLLFFFAMIVMAIGGSFRDPMISSLISERTKAEDQGIVLGINQSYVSLGQIIGPLAAGLVSEYSIRYTFLLSAGFMALAAIASRGLFIKVKKVDV